VSGSGRVRREAGGYWFLPSIRAFSRGVVADDDHEIVRARTDGQVPVADLPALVRRVVVVEHGRPPAAVCAVELRSPRPFTQQGFDDFNKGYAAMLDELGITVDGVNPVARTNVVPLLDPPAEPVVFGFSFTVPRSAGGGPTYVVAGAAETTVDGPGTGIVREGETGADALREKAAVVLARMTERLQALGARRELLTTAHVYTPHALAPELCAAIAREAGDRDGSFRLHPSRPPVEGLEFEMDMRCVAREVGV
jgi:hypothetical protein